jgi:GNAT superfamily N-acetyltransferase
MAPARLGIRRATVRDAPTVLSLIEGLARYERLTHQLEATLTRLRRHGFGRRPYFEALIARRRDRAVGFALYYFCYSTFLARPTLYLEDLFVLPDERRRGVGRALLRAVAGVAVRRGCGRMEWTVLDWNRSAIAFYDRLGARPMTEWTTYRLDGAALAALGAAGA